MQVKKNRQTLRSPTIVRYRNTIECRLEAALPRIARWDAPLIFKHESIETCPHFSIKRAIIHVAGE